MGRRPREDNAGKFRPAVPPGEVARAKRGIALRALVTEAVQEKVAAASREEEKPWLQFAGGLKHRHKERVRINRILESEVETIDPEGWA